jgi:hypothetical protein
VSTIFGSGHDWLGAFLLEMKVLLVIVKGWRAQVKEFPPGLFIDGFEASSSYRLPQIACVARCCAQERTLLFFIKVDEQGIALGSGLDAGPSKIPKIYIEN